MLRTPAPLSRALGLIESSALMNPKLANVFFLAVAIACVANGIVPLLTGQHIVLDDGIRLVSEPNGKDAWIGWLFLSLALPIGSIPALERRGIAQYGAYWTMPIESRARLDFILGTLSLPAAAMVSVVPIQEGCASGLNCRTFALAGALFAGHYFYSAYILIKWWRRKKNGPEQ